MNVNAREFLDALLPSAVVAAGVSDGENNHRATFDHEYNSISIGKSVGQCPAHVFHGMTNAVQKRRYRDLARQIVPSSREFSHGKLLLH